MILNPRPNALDGKPKKRSTLGLLFNPQLGTAISPLKESTRIFLQLLASVFVLYKLLPKNYPGLNDTTTPLSLINIIRSAWQNVQFTREGLPQTIIFFAVTGLMLFSGIVAVVAVFSLFIGKAHAQASTSAFTAPANDLAQSWLNYLFIGPSSGSPATYPGFTTSFADGTQATMADPFNGSSTLQTALMSALAFYSDAILIVAAIILFYHLASMVVETAHHGVPMGKRADQIWAPIRLVVAVGLLVPINTGLNAGQFIVLKMAEMGSALASNTWSIFLNSISDSANTIPPNAPNESKAVNDIVLMNACMTAWNYYVTQINGQLNTVIPMMTETTSQAIVGNVMGTKTSFSGNTTLDADICGWYFLPSGTGNALLQQAVSAQTAALAAAQPSITTAANNILNIVDQTPGSPSTVPPLAPNTDTSFQSADQLFNKSLEGGLSGIFNSQANGIQDAITQMQPYGWVMAGAFLNTIDRIQASMASAASDSMFKTSPPSIGGHVDGTTVQGTDAVMDLRSKVAADMGRFAYYQNQTVANTTTAQCSSMLGLTNSHSWTTDAVNMLFGVVDRLASWAGVWASGTGSPCSSSDTNQTFTLGVQFSGHDPFGAMAFLGQANLKTAFDIIGWFVVAKIGAGAATGAVHSFWSQAIPFWGTGASAVMGGVNGAIAALTPLVFLFASIFWGTGFTLAFLLPLMPFMRFFFAVLAWAAGLVEAIVAVPLVALAHLHPEGAGLPGQAKNAYFFIFSLFLRPVLIVFGLVCGLVIFLVALSFLNYAFAIAVAGAGGTTSGFATLAKILYTVLYVAILYICANHAFQLIDHIPQHAMSWMGASGQNMAKMGDAEKVENYGTLAGSYAGAKTMGAIGQGAGNTQKYMGALRQKSQEQAKLSAENGKPLRGVAAITKAGRNQYHSTQKDIQEKEEAMGLAEERHGKMIDAIEASGDGSPPPKPEKPLRSTGKPPGATRIDKGDA